MERFIKKPLYQNKNKTMKTTTKIIIAIILLLGTFFNTIYTNNRIERMKQETQIVVNEAKERITQANEPRELELKKIRIEELRKERAEVQAQIDMKVEYKKELIDETNLLKQELREELGL